MAKIKKGKSTDEKKIKDEFKNIKSGDLSIVENFKTNRKELQMNNKVIFSHINSYSCKKIAQNRLDIDITSWAIIK